MKKYTIIIFAMLLIGMVNNLGAQQMYGKWIVPVMFEDGGPYCNFQLTFSDTDISRIILPTAPLGNGVSSFSAGGYSPNYDWNFYVVGERLFYGSNSVPWADFSQELFPEYQIINKPQSVNEYFTFFTYLNHHERFNISYNTITYNPETEIATPSDEIIFREYDNGYAGFAITEEQNNQRYLFAASTEEDGSTPPDDGLYRWTITNSGLSEKTTIIQAATSVLTGDDFSAYNLEHTYYDDGNGEVDVIAWTHPETLVSDEIVVVIDDSPDILDLNLGRIGGIEFSTIDDNILYVSCTDAGIVAIDYTNYNNTGEIVYLYSVAPDYNYGRTFLQTAPDGNIYAVSNDGNNLGVILQVGPNAGNFESEDVFTFPNGGVSTLKVFDELNYYILPENSNTYEALEAEAFSRGVLCPGYTNGEVTIFVYGGVPFEAPNDPYTIDCTPTVQFSWDEDIEAFTATGLGEGTYDYTITDQYNTISDQFTINVDYSGYTHKVHKTFSESDTWNEYSESFAFGFTINNNAQITIQNSTLLMGELANIIIEPGSELIVNNSTITHYPECGPWLGIEIWGNTNQSQYIGEDGIMYQGKLVIEDSSFIKNAWNAVTTQNPINFYSHGGIIIAENSTFENNKRSVEILQYQNFHPDSPDIKLPYVHRFKNCTFVTDDNYLFPSELDKHVSIWDVYGIKFMGCKFKNNNTVAPHTGNGIHSLDAGYSLLNYCSSSTQPCLPDDIVYNEFHNLYKGVHASNSSSSRNTIYVNDANFINNSIGVYISNVHNAIVINSDFEVGYNEGDKGVCDDLASGFGIDAHSSIGFIFENNTFEKFIFAPADTYTGIRVYECRSLHDIIYKNTFDGLSFGNYAEGTNRESDDDKKGIEYQCNINSNNAVDFMVMYIEEPIDAKIRDYQGNSDTASGNTFSQGIGVQGHFINEGLEVVNLHYFSGDPLQIPNEDLVTYYYVNRIEALENTCPNHYGGGGDIKLTYDERQQKEVEYSQSLNDYNSVLSLYQSLENGGNTTAELLDIETAQPDDMWALRTQLLGDSPHLSQEVLMETSDRTDVFPDDVLFDILAANPDELKEDTLISYLENKEIPLPDYMIAILRQLAISNTTYKTILNNQMAGYYAAKTLAAQVIIHSILSDSVVDIIDYHNWLDNLGGLEADKQIIASYLSDNNTASAISLMNIVPSLYNLEGNELDDFNDYRDLVQMQLNWKSQGKNLFQLDSADIATLVLYADNNSNTAGNIARNILMFAYGYNYCDCLHNNDSTYYKTRSSIYDAFNSAFEPEICAKPNPARTWAAFDYKLKDDKSVGQINITDISGKTVHQFMVNGKQGQIVWNTRSIAPGMYFYTLTSNGLSKTGKIIVK